jgi:hypothetical protein
VATLGAVIAEDPPQRRRVVRGITAGAQRVHQRPHAGCGNVDRVEGQPFGVPKELSSHDICR